MHRHTSAVAPLSPPALSTSTASAINVAPQFVRASSSSQGVNIMAFCKEYNAATQKMAGDIIPVEISVYEVGGGCVSGGCCVGRWKKFSFAIDVWMPVLAC